MSDKYDPKYFCISDEELPLVLSSDGDPKKCELWVSIDKLKVKSENKSSVVMCIDLCLKLKIANENYKDSNHAYVVI